MSETTIDKLYVIERAPYMPAGHRWCVKDTHIEDDFRDGRPARVYSFAYLEFFPTRHAAELCAAVMNDRVKRAA